MATSRSLPSTSWIVGACFPLCVLAFTYFADPLGQPQGASASVDDEDVEIDTSGTTREAHPRAGEALEAIVSYDYGVQARNPFRYRDGELYNTIVDVTDTGPVMHTSEFQVTSILGGTSPIALINGKAYRQGDEVINGWRVEAIMPEHRQVTLRHADGRVRQATIQTNER
ncbi:MAG: hypothetical protein ACF8GE_09820 [Phycisphaerales bacterium JB043]